MEPSHLFSFLGLGHKVHGYSPCVYVQEASGWRTDTAVTYVQTASALLHQEQLGAITIFATIEAQDKHADALREELRAHKLTVTPRFVTVPSGFTRADTLALFDALRGALSDGPRALIFDMTHGFRAQPAIALMALNYLRSLDPDLTLRDLTYGDFREGHAESELVSLIDLWTLHDWAAAFDIFRETGSVRPLARLANTTHDDYFKRPDRDKRAEAPRLKNLGGKLTTWQIAADANAVPALFGHNAQMAQLVDELGRDWNPISEDLGRFIAPLRDRMLTTLAPLASAKHWGDLDGLRAQLGWMRWLAAHGQHQSAYTLMREWLTTLFQHALSLHDNRDLASWHVSSCMGSRKDATRPDTLNQLIATLDDDRPKARRSLSSIVDKVTERRNNLNHASHPKDASTKPTRPVDLTDELASLLDDLDHLLARVVAMPAPLVDEAASTLPGTTLFTPLGTSPDAILTALRETQPDRLAILTSASAHPERLIEALASSHPSLSVYVATVSDPFAGFDEAITQALTLLPHTASLNLINLAGGTTALQHGIRALDQALHQAQRPKRRGATFQRAPDAPGEWAWVDPAPAPQK